MTDLRYAAWLAEQAAARRLGPKLKPITRGEPWAEILLFTPDAGTTEDLTAGTMAMSIGTSPSDGLGETNDVTVGTVTLASGVYSIPVELNIAQTTAMPADDNGDEVVWLYYQVRHNSGPGFVTIAVGMVPVTGTVANG
jgi:hypothetical protein